LSTSRAGFAFVSKSMNLASCCLMHVTLLATEQVALGRTPAGIADHAGGAACQRHRVMAGELKAPQRELAHEMADVEAVAGGVKAAIERDRSAGQTPAEAVEVGAVRDQIAPLEVFEKVHGDPGRLSRRAGVRTRGK
jgi:hypothetical protein